MPRKTKEQSELENKNLKTTKKIPSEKKSILEKEKTNSTTSTTRTKKSNSSKKVKPTKNSTSKKESNSKAISKKSTTSKSAKKASTKKITTKKPLVDVVEYYDLPYRYNQTIVKLLAQTPTTLFVYWDISDDDKEKYKKQYGEDFFETTKPVLIVHNDSMNYSFEVEINDFANSWYLHVNDAKCDYRIELGRRPIVNHNNPNKNNMNYVYISTSNKIEAPNDRILFDNEQKMVYFRNVKTGKTTGKSISNISFIRNMGKVYHIYDLYKNIYKDENVENIYDLSNPSSGNPSSNSFSSRFK